MKTFEIIFILFYSILAIAFVWRILYKNKNVKKTIYFGFYIIYFALLFGFIWNFKKIIDIQYFSDKNYAAISNKLKSKPMIDYPKRGTIYCYDRNGEKVILSEDLPIYNIFFNGEHIHTIEKAIRDGEIIMNKTRFKDGDNMNDFFNATDSIKVLADQLAKKYGSKAVSYNELIKAYEDKNPKAKLLNTVIDFDIIKLKEISDFALLNGRGKYSSCLVKVEKANRIFPYEDLAKKTIGNVYKERKNGFYKGEYGIEAQFDSIMRGTIGEKQDLKISIKKTVTKIDPKKRKEKGADIILTLDMDMQEIVTECLRKKAQELNASNACAILMEVETGAIKAIANLGGSDYSEANDNLGNMAIKSRKEPGSVFKILSMMVALENKSVTPKTMINTSVTRFRVKEAHNRDYGTISAHQIIVKSSNRGVANIIGNAFEHNIQGYIEHIKKTSFDKNMDFDLEVATTGIDKINRDDIGANSIGYVFMPPIYMLRFYNAIANNGKMVEPFVVKDIIKNDKSVGKIDINGKTRCFPAQTRVVADTICSQKTLIDIKKMLIDVVKSAYQNPKVVFAGKTGTSNTDGHQITFCGYFPVDTENLNAKPKYSCIVVIYKQYAELDSKDSREVFRNIAEKIFIMENTKEFAQLDNSEKNINKKNRKIVQLSKKIGVK